MRVLQRRFPSKNAGANSSSGCQIAGPSGRKVSFLLGWVARTPQLIDPAFPERIAPVLWALSRQGEARKSGRRSTGSRRAVHFAALGEVINNEFTRVQGGKHGGATGRKSVVWLSFIYSLTAALPYCVLRQGLLDAAHLLDAPRSTFSSNLERAQSHHGEQHAKDIEAHDHLRFVPALALEVMMQGRH